jgi:crotonobetainyl-CoA:carnitine CoA-transferase CaiB-like acyl-CoA transferase
MDPIPETGEHSRQILSELGYSDKDIEELEQSGVI